MSFPGFNGRSARVVLLLSIGLLQARTGFGQLCPPNILWQKDRAATLDYFSIRSQTADGGYFLAGTSYRGPGPDKTSVNYGSSDFFLVRLNADLEQIWDRSYGGTKNDTLIVARQTADGGFILGGISWSASSGNKTSPFYGGSDFWVVRTDASGNMLWDKSFGGSSFDELYDVQETADGGFIVGGRTSSGVDGNKTTPTYGGSDYWVVRIDSAGNKLWEQTLGGTDNDYLSSVYQTSDGGFIVGGSSVSDLGGTKIDVFYGGEDYWVVRLDANGEEVWQHVFGGTSYDELLQVRQGANGGYILMGESTSDPSGNRTSPRAGAYPDIWVVALDVDGIEAWQQSAGGANSTQATGIVPMSDGGWVVGAISWGPGGNKTSPSFGYADYWLVRFGLTGQILWDQGYGGKADDYLYSISKTSDGGILLMGDSSSRPSGNKTTDLIGSADYWIVKLGLETPGDCDADGVPDAYDLCAHTPNGSIVNTNGCSIDQLCPCRFGDGEEGNWTNHAQYVECVSRVSADFVQAGLITEGQRSNIISQAEAANCPYIPVPILAFGLTNVPVREAFAFLDDNVLIVNDLGYEGRDGISMRLGEADSGVFFYPDAPVQYGYNDDWFMLAKAYGSLNGVTNQPLATMRGTKPYYETYPVTVDFSALGVDSVTYQVFSGTDLVEQASETGPIGKITINSSSYLGPRANPLWQAPDGSIGAVIDLDGTESAWSFSITGPFYGVTGDHIFIRANNPTNVVDFVSKVDLFTGGGLFKFSVLNARLGMFHRAHQALGSAIFNARGGKLQVQTGPDSTGYGEEFTGALIEASDVARFDAQLEPMKLETNGAVLETYVLGYTDGYRDLFGWVMMTNNEGTLALKTTFSPNLWMTEYTNVGIHPVLLKVYDNGALAGSLTNLDGAFTINGSNSVPGFVACGASAGATNTHLAFSLDAHAAFTDASGITLRGNQFRLLPFNPEYPPELVSQFTLGTRNVPSFTIVGEQSDAGPPALSIEVSSGNVLLSWPNQNQPFVLESTASLDEPFTGVTADVMFTANRYTVTIPFDPTSSRFFRLKLAQE